MVCSKVDNGECEYYTSIFQSLMPDTHYGDVKAIKLTAQLTVEEEHCPSCEYNPSNQAAVKEIKEKSRSKLTDDDLLDCRLAYPPGALPPEGPMSSHSLSLFS